MAFRPNFEDTVKLAGDKVVMAGVTDEPFPDQIHVYLEQGGRVARATMTKPAAAWQATAAAAGFGPGPALAFGVEVRTKPFMATSWCQTVTIR